MILVAHLFGSRVDLRPIATVARQHGAMLVEDCAQNFRGPGELSCSRLRKRRAACRDQAVFPIISYDPAALILLLRGAGFDASTKTMAIDFLVAPADRPDLDPVRGRRLLEGVVFLPVYPELGATLELLIATASSRLPTAA